MRERGVQLESWGPFAEGRNNLFSDPVLTEIGAGYGKSVAQVVLRWLIQCSVVVIPKSVRAVRMAQNFDVFDFELTDEQMARIATMDTGKSLFLDHRDPAMVSQLSSVRIPGGDEYGARAGSSVCDVHRSDATDAYPDTSERS